MLWYYNFINGLSNFWTYRSLIWNDRWYDHSYMISLIVFKLDTMIDNWDKAHYVGSDFTKKRMIVIRNRIKNYEEIIEDMEYDYIVNKKYTREEYRNELNKIKNKTWGVFGKNIRRFWD